MRIFVLAMAAMMAWAAASPAQAPQVIFRGDPLVPSWDWVNAGDPCVVRRGQQWWMFFTSMDLRTGKLSILTATLPRGVPLSLPMRWKLSTQPVLQPSAGAWDSQATETACLAAGIDPIRPFRAVERLYYTGWSAPANGKFSYNLGCAEWTGGRWVKQAGPLFDPLLEWETDPQSGSLLGDQSVLYDPDRRQWVMFYQVSAHGKTILAVATSDDGLRWPASRRKPVSWGPPNPPNGSVPGGPYHVDVTRDKDRYVFVGWLPQALLDQQGLWSTSARGLEPQIDTDFFVWTPLLKERGGPSWMSPGPDDQALAATQILQAEHQIGLFGSDYVVGENGTRWLFFHAVVQTPDKQYQVGHLGVQQLPSLK